MSWPSVIEALASSPAARGRCFGQAGGGVVLVFTDLGVVFAANTGRGPIRLCH
jgi:hypothetical protein